MLLRLTSAALATRIREPSSASTRVVAAEVLLATRLRIRAWRFVLSPRREEADVIRLADVQATHIELAEHVEQLAPVKRACRAA